MFRHELVFRGVPAVLSALLALPAAAQSFRVQCPASTITHPTATNNNSEPAYNGPTQLACTVTNGCGGSLGNVGYLAPLANSNGAIKCQQISGGDGYATMADGTQTFMFSFGPLSGLADIANGLPGGGTEFPNVFNTLPPAQLVPGDPATSAGATDSPAYTPGSMAGFTYVGAEGLTDD